MTNPTTIRLSKHFLLSDFMGNHSVYTRGYANNFGPLWANNDDVRMDNGMALCEQALESMLEKHGPLTVSYGFISPDISRQIVTYMDPDAPSHHRWDLGAAADVCVHNWVNRDPEDDTTATSPIMLAHEVHTDGIPYSRMITYSESPYICVAVSDREIYKGNIRRAFYENRFAGVAKEKPHYKQMPTESTKVKALNLLQETGLPHGWRGQGWPSHHGGGRRQLQHVRVSKYTMASDWLFNLQSIANGAKNIPNLNDTRLWETFCAVGDAYDSLLDGMQVPRMSIISGFVSPSNPFFDPNNDWRSGKATFSVVPPEGMTPDDVRMHLLFQRDSLITGFGNNKHKLDITVQI